MHVWSSLWVLQSQLVLRILWSGMTFTTRPACMVERKWLGFSNQTNTQHLPVFLSGLLQFLDSNILHVCRVLSSSFYTTTFPPCISLGLFSFSLIPRPHSKMGKGPGHTCKNFCMYCVSSLCLEYIGKSCSPITFLTHEGSRLIPRPKWNLHRRPGLTHSSCDMCHRMHFYVTR